MIRKRYSSDKDKMDSLLEQLKKVDLTPVNADDCLWSRSGYPRIRPSDFEGKGVGDLMTGAEDIGTVFWEEGDHVLISFPDWPEKDIDMDKLSKYRGLLVGLLRDAGLKVEVD